MATPNETLVYRWFEEIWNKGNLEVIDELFAADGIGYGLGEAGRDVRGPASFRAFVQRIRGAFPDIHITVGGTIEQDDRIAARFSATMTHTGDDLGFPATGRTVRVSGITFTRIANGQIVEGWNNWDIYGMMQQLTGDVAEKAMLLEES